MTTKSFFGGYRFKHFEGKARDEIVAHEIPSRVLIPLSQGLGSDPKLCVQKGDQVRLGQIIARDDTNISSPIHASLAGAVSDIKKMNYFNRETTMVQIDGDGSGDCEKIEGYSPRWDKLSAEKIEELIYLSGVASLEREGIPTRFKSSIIMPEEVEDLIIHGVESEAYNVSLELLLKGKNLYRLVEGIRILKKIMPKARIHLAVNKARLGILERVKKLASSLEDFTLYPLAPKYPQGYDEVLVPTILGKKFPYGYSAANIGIVVLNIQAVLHAHEAVTEGKPLIDRTIALCGPTFKKNIHLSVRIGAPLQSVLDGRLEEGTSRIVLNSLLTGVELNDLGLPISRTFSQIIAIPEGRERKLFAFVRPGARTDSYSRAFASCVLRKEKEASSNLHGESRPCIQCGYCLEVCPVRIIPTLIDRQARLGINETLMRFGVFKCIECNLCSYVCPSKIPLGKNMRDTKTKLIEIGCDNSICILPRFNLRGLDEYKGVKSIR